MDGRHLICTSLALATLTFASVAGWPGDDMSGDRVGTFATGASVAASATGKQVRRYRSRPDLRPPAVRVTRRARRTAAGLVFLAPKGGAGQKGPMIVDNRGQPVWFARAQSSVAMDLKVQHYMGRPVLTWFDGRAVKGWGRGTLVIADTSYRTVARVQAVGGLKLDHHDSLITPQGTALVFVYRPVRRSLAAVGGPRRGIVMDSVIQEIDIATGRLVFEWHSLSKIGLRESYKPPPRKAGDAYDYFHINSVQIDRDGDLVISARNTFAIYRIDRQTGAVIWRLGGKRSSFKMGRGTRFAWQHDARLEGAGRLTVFDNAAAPKVREQSRAIVLRLDQSRKRVSLVRQYRHPRGLLSASQANAQTLPNGNLLVGWGSKPYVTEFSRGGRVRLDMRLLAGSSSYRAYRFPWSGLPIGKPALAVRSRRGGITVYASWNGATSVAKWRVLAGAGLDSLRPVTERARTGFETALRARGGNRFVAVEALDGAGNQLGVSRALTMSPASATGR